VADSALSIRVRLCRSLGQAKGLLFGRKARHSLATAILDCRASTLTSSSCWSMVRPAVADLAGIAISNLLLAYDLPLKAGLGY